MNKLLMKADDLKALQACAGSKKDLREVLKCIHIRPEYVETTNGAQLLRIGREAISTDAARGVYRILSVNEPVKGMAEAIIEKVAEQFPATDNVIPKTAGMASISIQLLDDAMSLTRCIINLHTFTQEAYSLAVLERIAPLNNTWTVFKPEVTGKPLRMDYIGCDNTTYCAVFMPMQLKD